MTVDELVERACPEISYLGGLFYFAPGTLARAAELGLNSSQFYFIGRGGVLGDVKAAVADSALGYFAPSVVERHWEAGRKVLPPPEVARAYLECCREFGRRHLSGEDWLEPFCAAAMQVLNAASPTALPLFAGVKALAMAEDLPARAMQQVATLREFRGGVHLMAIVASGLEPRVAHWLTRPDAWANGGDLLVAEVGPRVHQQHVALIAVQRRECPRDPRCQCRGDHPLVGRIGELHHRRRPKRVMRYPRVEVKQLLLVPPVSAHHVGGNPVQPGPL